MSKLSDITAVILVGGLGTRLRSVVGDCPKVLVEVCGRPFLTFILDYLAQWNLKKVVLCTGYRGEVVQSTIGNHYNSLDLYYSQEEIPLGTGGALRFASKLFQSETVLVMNGDSICYADLLTFWIWHQQQRASASLLLTRVNDIRRFGQVVVDSKGYVLRFEEKNDQFCSGLISAGTYLIETHLIESIPKNQFVSLEKEMFPLWVGREFCGFQAEGEFIDIGTPSSYAEADLFFKNHHTNFINLNQELI